MLKVYNRMLRICNHLKATIPIMQRKRYLMTQETPYKSFPHYFNVIREFIIKQRIIIYKLPQRIGKIVIPYTFSNVAGHGSFLLLSVSYLETDLFMLRVYALSGMLHAFLWIIEYKIYDRWFEYIVMHITNFHLSDYVHSYRYYCSYHYLYYYLYHL